MIQTENISKEHYINNIKPDYFISFPFVNGEQINETNVTCFFCVETLPMKLKCVGIDFFDKIDNDIIKNKQYGKYYPTHIYIFKHIKFDLEEERKRLIIY
jgi:hypothetical protein